MDQRNTTAGRNATLCAFLIFLIYAALRWVVYSVLPVSDFTEWAVRDTLMNGPRLLVLALSVQLGLRFWNKGALGLHT